MAFVVVVVVVVVVIVVVVVVVFFHYKICVFICFISFFDEVKFLQRIINQSKIGIGDQKLD